MADGPKTVKTEVDSLLEFVRNKKEVSFEEAARFFTLPLATIEAWASFLEEEGMVSIKYKFTTPYFVYKDTTIKKFAPVSPFVIVDELANLSKEIPKHVESKDFEKAKQKTLEMRSKMATLPAQFVSENEELVGSMHDIQKKLDLIVYDIATKKSTLEDKRGELARLQQELAKKLDKMKAIAQSSKTEADRQARAALESMGESPDDMPHEKRDIKELIFGLANLLNKLSQAREKNELEKAEQLYMELMTTVRSLERCVEDECGLDAPAKKKIDKGLEAVDKLMEDFSSLLAKGDVAGAIAKLASIDETFRDIVFLLRTIYDEKKLIEKKEGVRTELENIEPLLSRVYVYIKNGQFEQAKELYKEIEEKYVMLPTEFIEKKNALKKDLIKLNKDLALSIAEKSKIELDAKGKAIRKLLKEASANLSKNRIQEATEAYDQVEALYNELPEGFIDDKIKIQHIILELQEKLLNRKKEIYFSDLKFKSAKIEGMLSEINKDIILRRPQEAISVYQKLRYIFGTLPEGFLEEKTVLQNKVLTIHREILAMRTQWAMDEMRTKSDKINEILIKANQMVLRNDIAGASRLYDEIEDIYRSLPDGFLVKKTELQNRILQISGEISKRLDRLSGVEMQRKGEMLKKQTKTIQNYLKKGENDLALAEYEEMVDLYNQLPSGFIEKKMKLRGEMLNLYRSIVTSTDALLIEDLSPETKKKYDEMLKVLVKMHHHIDANEFAILPTLYERINELYNSLPVGFVNQKIKIVNEIIRMFRKIQMYQLCLDLQTFVRRRDFEGLRSSLEQIYNSYNELLDQSREDLPLFNFVYGRYFTYHKILEEEHRIKGSILRIAMPGEVEKPVLPENQQAITVLRDKISKAEGHVSDLNFEFVRPIGRE